MAYLPATYNPYGYGNSLQQMYPQYQQSTLPAQPAQQTGGLNWVDGEVGAKAYQMPANWPANQPIALWDTNDTVIYLKSINPMGMPNPLQKAHYTLEEYKSATPGQSGAEAPDMSQYASRTDLENMKKELMDAINSVNTSGRHGRTEE